MTPIRPYTFLVALMLCALFGCSGSANDDRVDADTGGKDGEPDGYASGHDAGSEESLAREGADRIPCRPRSILQTVCQKCHSRPPMMGAPFPLVGRSDILGVRALDQAPIRELMIEQLESGRMPLPPEMLGEAERADLVSWLHEGAPGIPPNACLPDDVANGTPDE